MRYARNNDVCESTTPCTTDWSSIDWYKIEKYVNKQQMRIYHAERQGDSRKVRDLQRLLIHSNSTLLLAIKKVTQINKGKRTPGIDGYRAMSNEKRGELFDMLKSKNIKHHVPKPAFRKYIKKKNNKLRSLGIPVIVDRVYQEIIRLVLEPQAEANFEPISYGFRPKRGAHDAIERIWINTNTGNWKWVFEGDFKSCFDTLSHDFILEQIKGFPLYNLVERFLKAGYVDNNVFHKTREGTPQGGLLSPLLANIALTGLEKCLNVKYWKHGKYFQHVGKYKVVRYADDFVIFAKTKEDILEVYNLLQPYLDERGLILAEDKTRITSIYDGFDFLGFNIRYYTNVNKCLVKPSKDSIKSFKTKVNERFSWFNGHNIEDLIDGLNPLIRGTANYWRHVNSSDIFSKMDDYIWHKTYRFVRRLHPNKSWGWIKKKYFPPLVRKSGVWNWVLTDTKSEKYLFKMQWYPIWYHTMIKHDFSPYDKTKEEYFVNRANHYRSKG